MNIDEVELSSANDLAAINQKIGHTLGLLQTLEDSAALYFVLKAKASIGMGSRAGAELLAIAREATFGKTINEMAAAGLLNDDLKAQFTHIRNERNWLVHRSLDDKHRAVRDFAFLLRLMSRLDDMSRATKLLSDHLAEEAERFVLQAGISPEEIAQAMEAGREAWSHSETL